LIWEEKRKRKKKLEKLQARLKVEKEAVGPLIRPFKFDRKDRTEERR